MVFLTVPWYLNVNEAHAEIDVLTSLIRREFGESMEFFVHSDGCLDFSCRICMKAGCQVRRHAFEERVEWTLKNVIPNKKHQSPRSHPSPNQLALPESEDWG